MTLHGEAVFLGSLLFQISINIITTKSVLITNEIWILISVFVSFVYWFGCGLGHVLTKVWLSNGRHAT